MGTTIRQDDPPTPTNRRKAEMVDWPAVLEEVAAKRGQRGKWFRVAEYDRPETAKSSAVHAGRRHNADGRFEFATRNVNGVGVVWVRLRAEAAK